MSKMVNLDATAGDELLYILSAALSMKEKRSSKTIDVYAINDGAYISSIIVPSCDDDEPRDLLITKNTLYILHAVSVCSYKIIQHENTSPSQTQL